MLLASEPLQPILGLCTLPEGGFFVAQTVHPQFEGLTQEMRLHGLG